MKLCERWSSQIRGGVLNYSKPLYGGPLHLVESYVGKPL